MRKFLFPTVAAALVMTSVGAFAAGDTMTKGVVKSFDLKAHSLVLDNGISYVLPATFKDPGLKVGTKVTVGWQMVKKLHNADSVMIAK